ncbi:MAG: hypothetical protein KAS70_08505 [Planctomycetes bacterium]|nr:hypothetical protein [Planctomycetota bacterium]MCK5578503.1 hypothetical protein [Planctomycetota bacterium]
MKYGLVLGLCVLVVIVFILNGTALTKEDEFSRPDRARQQVGMKIQRAMKHMNNRINELEARVDELEEYIVDIEEYLTSLEDELGIVIEEEGGGEKE